MPRRDAATVRLAGSPALLPKKWSSGDLFIGDLEAPPPATGTGAGRAPRAATPPRLPPLSRAAAPSTSACRAAPSSITTTHHPPLATPLSVPFTQQLLPSVSFFLSS